MERTLLSAVTAYARLFVGGLILALLAVIAILNGQVHKWHTQADKQAAARAADRATYEQAQKDAAAANKAEVARIEQQQQKVTSDAEKSYEADLARLRAELGSLLAQDRTAKGAPNKPGASALPNAAGQPDDPSRVSIPTGLYVRGAELELQLERLQQWINEQMKVKQN